MKEFNVSKNPYGDKKNLYAKSVVKFESGLTVLVGCNGSGKSTLLRLVADHLKESEIRYMYFNNLTDGGHTDISKLMFYGDIQAGATMMMSSEGERIYQTIGRFISSIGREIRKNKPKELWVLLDAVSSGLSIDNIDEIKDFVAFIREQEPDKIFYFVICTNEYEFAAGEDCIDVTTFKHIRFKDYEEYKKYILSTKKKKNKRYE